jgi:hypothetical protein
MNDLPAEHQTGFTGSPSFEPTFGVRNACFHALHANSGQTKAKPAYLAPELLAGTYLFFSGTAASFRPWGWAWPGNGVGGRGEVGGGGGGS